MNYLITMIVLLAGAVIYLLFFRKGAKSAPPSDGLLLLQQKLDKLAEVMGTSLDKNREQVHESIQRQASDTGKQFAEVARELTSLRETNKQVLNISDELRTLQNILQNPKQRGTLGEYHLRTILENFLAEGQYELQYHFANGEAVDAVIILDRGLKLPIDSKFSLENYNRLVGESDPALRELLVKQFKIDLKNRIDETAKYIRPAEGTTDFAFMFIPSEAIYYDLLANKIGVTSAASRDLIEYAFRDKHVIIASPTTFMAYLQTVIQGLRSLQIEQQAKEIQTRVGLLSTHLSNFENFMHKVGGSLATTVGHYNTAHKELKKIDKDIVKIADTADVVEPLLIDKPQLDE